MTRSKLVAIITQLRDRVAKLDEAAGQVLESIEELDGADAMDADDDGLKDKIDELQAVISDWQKKMGYI